MGLRARFARANFLVREGFEVLGGVFISYRREDSGGFAGRIYDRLSSRLGRDGVFFDVDNIPPGLDFVDVLSERVGKCDALVAVIGRAWNPVSDQDHRARIDDPNDFVRLEIEAALARGIRVIPVLVDGAPMPRAEDLPESLRKLTRRQGIEISLTRFESDAERLTEALSQLEQEIHERETREAESAAPPAGEERRESEPAQRPTQVGATVPASVRPAANLPVEPSAPDASLPAPAERAKPSGRRSLLYLALAGLAVAGAAAALLQQSGSRQGMNPSNAPASPAAAAVAPKPDAEPDEWLSGEAMQSEFNKQWAAGYYPDMTSGRCEEGALSYRARWAEKQPDQRYLAQRGLTDGAFSDKKTELLAQGYKIQYENTFMDCQGRTRHQALWTKSG
jgi:TIR domain